MTNLNTLKENENQYKLSSFKSNSDSGLSKTYFIINQYIENISKKNENYLNLIELNYTENLMMEM